MNKNISTILVIITGVVLSIYIYKELKSRKSFLKMTDAEKKKFALDETKKRLEIKNNPNLTQEEKNKAEEELNKKNLETFTQAEQKAMADYYVNQLQTGQTKLLENSVPLLDLSLGLNSLNLK
jgi:predicted Holliday junction resolvase-like endonuclease